MKNFELIDENTVKKTESVTTETVQTYSKEELLKQREAIEAHKERDNALRDAELAEVDELLTYFSN